MRRPERHFYSVPYKYVGQMVKVMWDAEFVEVYVGDDRVAFHQRSLVPYGYATSDDHMPENHTAYEAGQGQNAATLIERGMRIGAVRQVGYREHPQAHHVSPTGVRDVQRLARTWQKVWV